MGNRFRKPSASKYSKMVDTFTRRHWKYEKHKLKGLNEYSINWKSQRADNVVDKSTIKNNKLTLRESSFYRAFRGIFPFHISDGLCPFQMFFFWSRPKIHVRMLAVKSCNSPFYIGSILVIANPFLVSAASHFPWAVSFTIYCYFTAWSIKR